MRTWRNHSALNAVTSRVTGSISFVIVNAAGSRLKYAPPCGRHCHSGNVHCEASQVSALRMAAAFKGSPTQSPRSGLRLLSSSGTVLWLLNTIVGRSLALNAGQRGSFGVLGSPFRANAIQASLTLSASAGASGLLDVRRELLTLSNAKGISIVCGDFSRPPST